jgi:hypothetical protein
MTQNMMQHMTQSHDAVHGSKDHAVHDTLLLLRYDDGGYDAMMTQYMMSTSMLRGALRRYIYHGGGTMDTYPGIVHGRALLRLHMMQQIYRQNMMQYNDKSTIQYRKKCIDTQYMIKVRVTMLTRCSKLCS